MREILFRGKTKIGGFWFKGAYVPENKIIIGYFEVGGHDPNEDLTDCKSVIRKVLPETVGQYTGLTDKNGKRIFEGDIVEYDNVNYEIKYIEGFAAFDLRSVDNMNYAPRITTNTVPRMIVIGNIHDNPELLNKEAVQNGG